MAVQRSQRCFDANGPDDAPAGSCFENGESPAEDGTSNRIPSEAKHDRVGGEKGGQDQCAEDGSDATQKASRLSFGVQIALKHIQYHISIVYESLFGWKRWSQRRDSNPRPSDYKSDALPAVLRWLRVAGDSTP